jgi:hypothetical protein
MAVASTVAGAAAGITPFGAGLMGASMLMQIIGMIGNARATARAQGELLKRKRELDLEYKKDLYTDFLNTPEAQSALSTLTKKYIENVKRADQGAVISGASDERTVATAEKLHQPFQALISNLAGYGAQRKESIRNRYAYQDQNLQNLIYSSDLQKIQNWSNLASNIGGAMEGFAAAGTGTEGEMGAGEWFRNLFGSKGAPGTKKGKTKLLQSLEAGG